jgi:hypothetical protein
VRPCRCAVSIFILRTAHFHFAHCAFSFCAVRIPGSGVGGVVPAEGLPTEVRAEATCRPLCRAPCSDMRSGALDIRGAPCCSPWKALPRASAARVPPCGCPGASRCSARPPRLIVREDASLQHVWRAQVPSDLVLLKCTQGSGARASILRRKLYVGTCFPTSSLCSSHQPVQARVRLLPERCILFRLPCHG